MNDKLVKWLIEAVLHLSRQVHHVERKVDILIRNSQVDFTKEDQAVLATAKTVQEALDHIPHPEQPTINPKG